MICRDFITALGGAAVAWPLVAGAQQAAMPVIGLLDQRSPEALADRLRGFREGLRGAGLVEDQSVVTSTAGAITSWIGFRSWRPTWCADRLP